MEAPGLDTLPGQSRNPLGPGALHVYLSPSQCGNLSSWERLEMHLEIGLQGHLELQTLGPSGCDQYTPAPLLNTAESEVCSGFPLARQMQSRQAAVLSTHLCLHG